MDGFTVRRSSAFSAAVLISSSNTDADVSTEDFS